MVAQFPDRFGKLTKAINNAFSCAMLGPFPHVANNLRCGASDFTPAHASLHSSNGDVIRHFRKVGLKRREHPPEYRIPLEIRFGKRPGAMAELKPQLPVVRKLDD